MRQRSDEARSIRQAGITTGYVEKPCLDPHDPLCPTTAPNWDVNPAKREAPDVVSAMNGGCSGFAAKYMKWHEDLIIGGVHKNKTNHITR